MKRVRMYLLPIILCLGMLGFKGTGHGQVPGGKPFPGTSCVAAVVVESRTGQILYEKNAFLRMHPASLTKMMTALLTLEIARLDDPVQVSLEASYQEGSSMYLREGDIFTVEDLLYGLMLNSGNDAAWALAEHVAKQVEGEKGVAQDFFKLMNKRARDLGAINTSFANPHGLTEPNHYTTAYDLSLIARTCLKHPYFKHLVATKEKDVVEGTGRTKLLLSNTNRLLWMYLGADGVKTGTTASAGQCLVASATRGELRLLAVVLDSGDRWSDAAQLFDHGFEEYTVHTAAKAWEPLAHLPCKGPQKTVPVVPLSDIRACIPQGSSSKVHLDIRLPPSVRRQCKRGTVLGYATFYLGDVPLGSFDLAAGIPVHPPSALRTLVTWLAWLIKSIMIRL